MNHSIYSADRALHLKILVVALVASIAIAGFAIGARVSHEVIVTHTVKAGQPVMMSGAAIVVTR